MKFLAAVVQNMYDNVASLVEAWIEIGADLYIPDRLLASLPSRRRGLKSCENSYRKAFGCVASLAEAWIEISKLTEPMTFKNVTSLAEAWIEIVHPVPAVLYLRSPPSRRRGLK